MFRASSVALMVSAALSYNAFADVSHIKSSFSKLPTAGKSQQSEQQHDQAKVFDIAEGSSGVYIVRLSEKAVLDKSYASLGEDRKSVLSKVTSQQDKVSRLIQSLDGSAIIANKVRMIDNSLEVQMEHATAALLTNNPEILDVILTDKVADMTEEAAVSKYPFLEVKDPGDSITVAIIGNGVDYTHNALNGVGTAEAYELAWRNNSNAWDGFPTDTVIGGMDFAANFEGWHTLDYNPIENKDDLNVAEETAFYPSGTVQAAMILEQEPSAKILSYKTLDWSWSYFYPALDIAIDPNQDGDFSDRPDIVLVNAYGGGGFYQRDGVGTSAATRQIEHVRRVAALGSLVISPTGAVIGNHVFNLSAVGSTPEALTVGSVGLTEDGSMPLSMFTPAGPTRGETYLKPEVVAPGENVVSALVGTGSEIGEVNDSVGYSAAYAAGVAAKAWTAKPELSALEVKALVTNTANHSSIVGSMISTDEVEYLAEYELGLELKKYPEVPFMGAGSVQGESIVNATAALWESSTYQPGLAFGFIDVKTGASMTKMVTVRNLTEVPQTYSTNSLALGIAEDNAGVNFILPKTVSVPANQSVSFPVTITLDAESIAGWPINKSSDYSIENWMKAGVNGYITLTSDSEEAAPEIKIPWLVFPKKAASLDKANTDFSSRLFYQSDKYVENETAVGWWTESKTIDVTNTSDSEFTYFVLPTMRHKAAKSEDKMNSQGQLFANMGASISPISAEMCPSGQALTVGVEMFDRFEVPMAEHFDKVGDLFSVFKVFTKAHTEEYASSSFELDQYASDQSMLVQAEIRIMMDGRAVTRFVDYGKVFDRWNPDARWTESSLETYVSPNGKTAVSQICMDDLMYSGNVDRTMEDWDGNLGWIFASDRDAVNGVHEQAIIFDPAIGGEFREEIVDHTGETGYPNWWDTWTPCEAKSWDEDYCIENKSSHLAASASVAILPDEYDEEAHDDVNAALKDAGAWSSKVTIAPGETARFAAGMNAECDPNIVSTGARIIPEDCPTAPRVFDITMGKTSPSHVTSGTDVTIVSDQAFSIYENAENSTIVGQLDIDSPSFFNLSELRDDIRVFLVNAVLGTPFAVSTTGEITVANAEALDYESVQQYELELHVDHVNRDTEIVTVTVNVNNENDVAPIQTESLASINTQTGEVVAVNIASAFTDVEGDGITFFSNNLPSGLTLSANGDVTGSVNIAGSYTVAVQATDGVNTTNSTLAINVTAKTESNAPSQGGASTNSSGGSFGLFGLFIIALSFVNRRVRNIK